MNFLFRCNTRDKRSKFTQRGLVSKHSRTLGQRKAEHQFMTILKNIMADDDRNRRKAHPDRDGTPDWHETCIGIWSRSTKGHHVNEGEHDKICNGISLVRIHGKVSL